MNYSDYRFTLDVQIHQAQVSIPVTLNDTARRLCIGLTDGRKPYYIADGCRAVFVAKKPNDTPPIVHDCIIERNTIIYEFSQNTTNAEGVVNCEIRLFDADNRVLTSPQFNIVVDKNVVRDEEIPITEDDKATLSHIITSELGRVNAENARQEAEDSRDEAEKARVEAEAKRVEAEKNREEAFEIPNILPGEGKYSIEQNDVLRDGKINTALSESASALGTGTTAGAFAFKITAQNSTNKTYTLSGTPTAYAVGDVFSVRGYVPSLKNYSYYDSYGTITAIDGKIITVDNFVEFTISGSYSNIFHVPEKPAEGDTDIGTGASTEGCATMAVNIGAHSEGYGTKAQGRYSHAEGSNTKASYSAHSEGGNTKAGGEYSHAEGYSTESSGDYSHTEGANTTATNPCSHAEGLNTAAKGNNSHAEGKVDTKGLTKIINDTEYAVGAIGNASHSEGINTIAKGDGSHAEGNGAAALQASSHAEGNGTIANGEHSHAEGIKTTTNKIASHAEGNNTTADGNCSHAEGQNTLAKGTCSHAEGDVTTKGKTRIINDTEYAVGATGYGSHVEGRDCIASNEFAHAEGKECAALGARSHAGGLGTIASGANQRVVGKYNVADANKAVIVGGGSSDSDRKNIHTVDWSGNAVYAGSVTATSFKGKADSATKADTADTADRATDADNAIWAAGADVANNATKATQDGNGKVIADTYAPLSKLMQTITRTFDNGITFGTELNFGTMPTGKTINDVVAIAICHYHNDGISTLHSVVAQENNLADGTKITTNCSGSELQHNNTTFAMRLMNVTAYVTNTTSRYLMFKLNSMADATIDFDFGAQFYTPETSGTAGGAFTVKFYIK